MYNFVFLRTVERYFHSNFNAYIDTKLRANNIVHVLNHKLFININKNVHAHVINHNKN